MSDRRSKSRGMKKAKGRKRTRGRRETNGRKRTRGRRETNGRKRTRGSRGQSALPMPSLTRRWTIYGASYCPYCNMALSELRNRGEKVTYVELDSKKYQGRMSEYKRRIGAITKNYPFIPVIFYYRTFIGGYEDLMKLTR